MTRKKSRPDDDIDPRAMSKAFRDMLMEEGIFQYMLDLKNANNPRDQQVQDVTNLLMRQEGLLSIMEGLHPEILRADNAAYKEKMAQIIKSDLLTLMAALEGEHLLQSGPTGYQLTRLGQEEARKIGSGRGGMGL